MLHTGICTKNYGVPLVYQNVLINADQLNYDIHTFANGRIFTSFSSCLGISSWRICMRERTRGEREQTETIWHVCRKPNS